jgi:hypothetical protein
MNEFQHSDVRETKGKNVLVSQVANLSIRNPDVLIGLALGHRTWCVAEGGGMR